jgi:hypothetical protein
MITPDKLAPVDFSDLEALDWDNAAVKAAPAPQDQPCLKCAGKGEIRYGYVNITYYPCSLCKGTGRVTDARLKRVAAHRKGVKTAADNKVKRADAWHAANPAESQWMRSRADRFDFAASMLSSVAEYGKLTDKQLDAVRRCMAKDAERNAARNAEAKAREVTLGDAAGAIRDALNQAHGKGLKSPQLRTEHFNFERAKDSSRNPGCVYVLGRPGGAYLGKITPDGTFCPSRDCTAEQRAHVATVAADPLGAAVAFGRLSGECSCCGRRLTDPVSIANGIGPVCASNFFGG